MVASEASAGDPFVGRTVGPARLERKLGQGGMGLVYLGRHQSLGIPVAIKMLPPVLARDDTLKQRFLREAKAIASLNHPHLLRVYDFGAFGDGLYLVMEFVDGGSISDLMGRRGGRLAIDEAVRLAREAASALEAVHRAGIVHRDIKPENLLVGTEGQLKVADFGLAHQQGGQTLSATGMILGSPAFMSPEQASGKPVDVRSDVFSLGVTLYAMLAGASPFSRTHPMACLLAVIEDAIPAIELKADAIPAGLAALVRAMMEREPERRMPSMHAVSQALAGDLSDPTLVDSFLPAAQANPATATALLTGASAGTGTGKARGSGSLATPRRASSTGLSRPRSGSSITGTLVARRGGPPPLAIAGAVGAVALVLLVAMLAGAFSNASGVVEPPTPTNVGTGSGSVGVPSTGSGSPATSGSGSGSGAGSAANERAAFAVDLRAEVARLCADRAYARALAQIEGAREAAPLDWDRELGPVLESLAADVIARATSELEEAIALRVEEPRKRGDLAVALAAAEALFTTGIAQLDARRAAVIGALKQELATQEQSRAAAETARAQARQKALDDAWVTVRVPRAAGRIEEACAAFEVVRADDTLRELRTRPDAREMEALVLVSETWRAHVARQIRARKDPEFRHPTLGEMRLLEVRAAESMGSVTLVGATPRPQDLPLDEIPAESRAAWAIEALAKSGAGWESDLQWCLRLGLYCLETGSLAAARQWLDRAGAEDARSYLARLAELERLARDKPQTTPEAATPELDDEKWKALLKLLGEAIVIDKPEVLDRSQLKVKVTCKFRGPSGTVPDYAFEPDHRSPSDSDDLRSGLRWAEVGAGGVELINGYLHVHLPVFTEIQQVEFDLSNVDPIQGRTGYAVAMVGERGLQIGPIGVGQKIRVQGAGLLRSVDAVAETAPMVVARPKRFALRFEDLRRAWTVEGKVLIEEDDFDLPSADSVAIAARDLRAVVRRIAVTGILAPDRIAAHAKRKAVLAQVMDLADKKAEKATPIFLSRDAARYSAAPGWSVAGGALVNDQLGATLSADVGADFYLWASYVQEPMTQLFQSPIVRLVNECEYWLPVAVGGGGRHVLRMYRHAGVTHTSFNTIPLVPRLGSVAVQYRSASGPARDLMLAPLGARFRIAELGFVGLGDLVLPDR